MTQEHSLSSPTSWTVIGKQFLRDEEISHLCRSCGTLNLLKPHLLISRAENSPRFRPTKQSVSIVSVGERLFAYLLAGISAVVFGLLAGAPFGEGRARAVIYGLTAILFWSLFNSFKSHLGRKLPVWSFSCENCEKVAALALSKTHIYFLEDSEVVGTLNIEHSRRAFTRGVKILFLFVGLPLAIIIMFALLRSVWSKFFE
jgi:hypothetical protein